MSEVSPHPASFRDPSGHIFRDGSALYRQINASYQPDYDLLITSGLYESLTKTGLLIAHEETNRKGGYKVIKPEIVPFISYPYEWSFSQLQAAARATLQIQFIALEHGMNLKDASAYNIQFVDGKPVLIDTLSFETYHEGSPWVAYRQYCQHFLAPLALMSLVDIRLGTLSASYIDGVPLDLAVALLPGKSRFSLGLGTHLFLHARSQRQHADDGKAATRPTPHMPKQNLNALLHNLDDTTQGLRAPKQDTEWGEYYENTNYKTASQEAKNNHITKWLKELAPATAWDAGGNDGTFSRLASATGAFTLSTDIDPQAIEHNYKKLVRNKEKNLLPLVIDLTNPSPSLGWANTERDAFLERVQVDVTLALALIHHLAISNNLPLGSIANLFAAHTKHLIIEFVPKEDSNTSLLLATREDIFPNYTVDGFEKAFLEYFTLQKKEKIADSYRVLYLFKKK